MGLSIYIFNLHQTTTEPNECLIIRLSVLVIFHYFHCQKAIKPLHVASLPLYLLKKHKKTDAFGGYKNR